MTGRIPETTRSGNPLKRHPTTQNMPPLNYDYLETKP